MRRGLYGVSALLLSVFLLGCGELLNTTTNTVPAPTVASFGTSSGTPVSTSGSTDILTTAVFSLTFSTAMDSSTVNTTNVTLSCDGTSQTIAISTTGNIIYTITPAASMPEGVLCVLTVGTGVKNAAGTALAAAVSFTFATTSTVPTVSSLVQGSTTIATSGTTDVARSTSLTLTFSEAMLTSTVTTSTVTLSCNSTSQTVTIAEVTSGATSTAYTVTPSTAMPAETSCTFSVSASITNQSGTNVTAKTYTFTTAEADAPPTVSSLVQGATTIVVSGTTNINRTSAYTLTFSEAMLASTVTTTSVTLTCGSSQTITVTQVTGGLTSTAYTVTPTSTLPAETSCTLAVGTGATNSSSVAVTAKSYTYTTGAVATPTVNSLTGTAASDGSSATIATTGTTGLSGATDAPLSLVFSTAMDANTVDDVTLECPDGTTKAYALGSDSNPTFSLTPSAALPQMQTCVLEIPATVTSDIGDSIAAISYTYETGCGTSDDFSNPGTFSSSSTICWAPANAGKASTFEILGGNLEIATGVSTGFETEPRATKTFPSNTTAITVITKVAYAGIDTDGNELCTMMLMENGSNYAQINVSWNGSVSVDGAAGDGLGGDVSGTAVSPGSPIYWRFIIANGAIAIAYSADGTNYTDLLTNGVWTDPTGSVSLMLSARSGGVGTTTCSFQDVTVTGATATGQYSN